MEVARRYRLFEHGWNRDAEVLVVCYGIVSRVAAPLAADYALFRPIRIHPVLDDELHDVASGYREVVVIEANDPVPERDGSGWTTVATFLPDGPCREANVLVEVREKNYPPIRVRIRGVTGATKLLPVDPNVKSQGPATNHDTGGGP